MKKNNFITFYLFILFQYFITLNVYSEPLIIGDKNAKIKVKVFSSLTCPHCASFHKNIYKKLKEEYIDKNKVRLEHHAFPLDLAALNAEKIIRCEKNPVARFKLLSKIYELQEKWAVGSDIKKINDSLINIASETNISREKLLICLKNENTQEAILNERIEAQKKYKISSTPTIYINDKKYEDKHEFKSFKKQIDKLL